MSDYQDRILKTIKPGDWDKVIQQLSDYPLRRKVQVVPGLYIVSNRDYTKGLRGKYYKMIPDGTPVKECKRLFKQFTETIKQKQEDVPF